MNTCVHKTLEALKFTAITPVTWQKLIKQTNVKK